LRSRSYDEEAELIRASALIACVLVAAVADSRGELTGSAYMGLAIGVAFLLWVGGRRTSELAPSRLPTRLDLAKARYTYGTMSVEEFERDVGNLLGGGHADEPLHVDTQDLLMHDDDCG
jgi:hypothetical protein